MTLTIQICFWPSWQKFGDVVLGFINNFVANFHCPNNNCGLKDEDFL